MLRKNVFLLSVRDGKAGRTSAVQDMVVCSTDGKAARELLIEKHPDLTILAVTGLVMLEERVAKIRAVLGGSDTSWPIVVDSRLG